MNLFKSVIIPCAGLAMPCYPATAQGSPAPDKLKDRPNIIFILTDDQRWDALGYAGNKLIQTPEMDKLAKEGVFFQYGISSTPICSASRASILTGLYERTHKYTFQTGDVREEYMKASYPALLNEAGYYTGFYGKLGVNYAAKNDLFDVIEDFDRNNGYNDHRGFFYKTLGNDTVHLTRYTGQKALDFIDTAPGNQPFCLSLSFSAPHAHDSAPLQYFWTEKSDHLYRDMDMPDPKIADDKYFYELPTSVREGFNRLRWGWRYDTPEKYQHSVKGYYRMIHDIDLEIARIRKKLKENGLDKNTVIILMGDNGYFMGERQLAGKWLMHDPSIRVPLFIYDPRIRKPVDVDALALNIDIPATILDLAGVQIPTEWHGKSLMPLVTKKEHWQRDTVLIEHLWEFENIPPSEGVRTNEWKYFRYVNDKSIEELYYLPNDPHEINNLSKNNEYRTVLSELRNKLDQLIKNYADPYSGIPSGLMVEYIRDPANVLINAKAPGYSWVVPTKAVFQNAYQILVASSEEKIDQNIGDIWNSGQVRSGLSTSVRHGGRELVPYTNYFWKVRIWDQTNRLSEYSDVQAFRTGSLEGYISTANALNIERIHPVIIKQTGNNKYFVDFGKAAFGTVEINYSSAINDTLIIRLGEKNKGNTVDMNPGGTIRAQEVKLAVGPGCTNYTVKLVPDKRNTNHLAVPLPDSLDVVMPFRYCEIENFKTALKSKNIVQKARFGYFDYEESFFTSNDTILNQIWDLCKYSIKATSFMGFYIDGDRERIPYEADAYINQLCHYGVDREYSIARQTIEWFMDKPTWPTEWQLHMALMFYEDYMYTHDPELIKKYYEPLKHKTLMALEHEHGLISTESPNHNVELMLNLGFQDTTQRLKDIVDWPAANFFKGAEKGETDGYEMVPINTVVNSFYYRNMVIMAYFAHILNKTKDKDHFEYMAAKARKGINEKLFDSANGIYVDGMGSAHSSLHANMFPLAFGIVPDDHKKSVAEFVKSRGMACSVYGSQYLMDALYNAGEADYALQLMTATHDRSWYNMIAIGSTITLEAWDMKYKPNSDWNHAWGAVPANIIPRQLWGITPKRPGFDIVNIKPQLATLTTTSIIVPTIKGQIRGDYQFVSDRLQRYKIELPANMSAEFFPDCSAEDIVIVNGVKANLAFESIRLEPGINDIEIRINSF